MRWGRRRAETRPSGTDRSRTETPPSATGRTSRDASARTGFLVEEYDRLMLLRRFSDELLLPADIADLTRTLESDTDGTMTVVAGADEASAPALWPRLAALLDTLRGDGVDTVRLAMSGAGDERPGLPSVARRIADAWGFDVIAPDGAVLGVPGGGLFVHDLPPGSGPADRERGWWLFPPGAPAVPLGPRQPAPDWQPAPGSLPSRTRGGCVVQHIPAGVLIRPDRARAPRPGDLCFAVPVDRRGLLVVVGVPDGEDVVTDDVADVVTALADTARTALRVAPGGRRDVLRVGQGVAELTDAEVVVYSGLPLLTESGRHRDTVRSTTVHTDGTPSWQPFVDSVICAPGASSPRLLRWTPPLSGPGDPRRGLVRLSDRWQVTATRAGLWIGGTDSGPGALADRPVDARGPEIEVGRPGEVLDRSLSPVLERLLAALPQGMSSRARLHVHGTAADGGQELRRLAALYQVRSLRFAAFTRTAPPEARPEQAANEPAGHPATPPGERRRQTVSGGPAPAAPAPAASVPPSTTPLPAAPMPAAGPVPPAGARPDTAAGPQGAATPARAHAGGSPEPTAPAPTTSDPAAPEPTTPVPSASTPAASTPAAPAPAAPAPAAPAPARTASVPTAPATTVSTSAVSGPASGAAVRPPSGSDVGTHGGKDAGTHGGKDVGTEGGSDGVPARGPAAAPQPSPTPPHSVPTVTATSTEPTGATAGAPATTSGPGAPATTGGSGAPTRPDRNQPLHAAGPSTAPAAPAATVLPEPNAAADGATAAAGAAAGAAASQVARTGASAGAPPLARQTPPVARTAPSPRATEPQRERNQAHGALPDRSGRQERARTEAPEPRRPALPEPEPDTARNSPERGSTREPSLPGPPVRPRLTSSAPAHAELPHRPEASHGTPAPVPGASATLPVPDGAPAPQPLRPAQPLPAVPFQPGHQSTPAERAAFRVLADALWDRQAAVVTRAFTRMPALRGPEQEAARADLVALLLYLGTPDGPLGHEELDRCLRVGDPRLLPYAACVASALRRLPSFRGAALRGTGECGSGTPAPGAVLRDPAPVSALPTDGSGAYPASTRYAVWSVTGRRVRHLFGATGPQTQPDEVVFAPGTVFKVLDVRDESPSPLVLLRELPLAPGTVPLDRTQLDDQDRTVRARLDEALARRPSGAGTFDWPGRCAGPVGPLDH